MWRKPQPERAAGDLSVFAAAVRGFPAATYLALNSWRNGFTATHSQMPNAFCSTSRTVVLFAKFLMT
jgi:hypothetical protein